MNAFSSTPSIPFVPPTRDSLGWLSNTVARQYRIDSIAAEGGFGIVYRAHHLAFGEPVAIKMLKLRSGMQPDVRRKILKHFLAEGRILYRLAQQDDAVVRPLALGEETSPTGIWCPFLVLEWLEGCPLGDVLREQRGRWPLRTVIELLDPVVRALDVAHGQRITHRDLKPDNLFWVKRPDGSRTLKLLDFGVAKTASFAADTFALTSHSYTAFSKRYGAPEQFDSAFGGTGPWTDVHALALIVVELLSGAPAYVGKSELELAREATSSASRPTPRTRSAEVSDAIEAVFERALAADPRNRHRRAGEFWSALRSAATQPPRRDTPPPFARSYSPYPGA